MKFRTKVTLCMISLVSVLFGAGSSSLISHSFQNSLSQEENSAKESYNMILNTLQIVNDVESWSQDEDISNILEQLSSRSSWAAIHLFSADKDLYSQGDAVSSFLDLSKQTDSTHCAYTILSLPEDLYYLQLSGAFYMGEQLLQLDIAYDISAIYAAREIQQKTYFKVFVLLVLVCAFFSYILALFLTRPLTQLSRASRIISAGNYHYRSRIRSDDEIGSLSHNFNLMADHLLQHMDELQAAMNRQNQFIGNFTHELKTPMTSIIGYADLLRRQNLSQEDTQDAANYIFLEGKRLERLSLTLLNIFVMEEKGLHLVPASPSKLISNLVQYYNIQYLRQNILLTSDCQKGCCLLEPDLFVSLIVNLMENARRAIVDKGKIQIECQMTEEGCCITVTDNGRGIPEDALEHITEAFYRIDKSRSRAQGGAGLGLTLCSQIAELHHGSMKFKSTESVGTTVIVNLKGGRK